MNRHGAPSATAPAREWFTPAEAIAARSPDLPTTIQSFNRLAVASGWRADPAKAQRTGGKGDGWTYHLSVFSAGTQARLILQHDPVEPPPQEPAVDGASKAAWARFDALSALILNAGVGTAGPIETAPRQSVEKTIQVNFTSALTLIQQSLPMLRTAADRDTERGAKVIALASITGVYPEPGLAVYGATKAALISLIATLNAEESAAGVTATAIAPGYVDTDMSAWVSDTIAPSSMIRVADVVEVVNMVLRLGRTASIAQIVMSRSGSPGYLA